MGDGLKGIALSWIDLKQDSLSPMQFRALIDRVGSSLQQLIMPEQCTEATFKVFLDRLESKPFVIQRFSLLKNMLVSSAQISSIFSTGCFQHLQRFPQAGCAMKVLRLSHTQADDQLLNHVAKMCPKLNELDVTGCDSITDQGLISIATHCSELRSVLASYISSVTDLAVLSLAARNPKLTRAHFSDCHQVTDIAVSGLVRCCPALQSVHFSDCSKVTDSSMLVLAASCAHLRKLWLPGCSLSNLVRCDHPFSSAAHIYITLCVACASTCAPPNLLCSSPALLISLASSP